VLPLIGVSTRVQQVLYTLLPEVDFWIGYLAYLAAVGAALVALFLATKANEVSLRLLDIEENRSFPFLSIPIGSIQVDNICNGVARMSLRFRNITELPIHNVKIIPNPDKDNFVLEGYNQLSFDKWMGGIANLNSTKDSGIVIDFVASLSESIKKSRTFYRSGKRETEVTDEYSDTMKFYFYCLFNECNKCNVVPLTIYMQNIKGQTFEQTIKLYVRENNKAYHLFNYCTTVVRIE